MDFVGKLDGRCRRFKTPSGGPADFPRIPPTYTETWCKVSGDEPGTAGGPVSLAFADVDLLESRTLSPTRTMLLLGASVTIGVIAIFGVNGNPGSEGQLPGGPVFQRLPLFRLVLGH